MSLVPCAGDPKEPWFLYIWNEAARDFEYVGAFLSEAVGLAHLEKMRAARPESAETLRGGCHQARWHDVCEHIVRFRLGCLAEPIFRIAGIADQMEATDSRCHRTGTPAAAEGPAP
jgi:hypothetical protein